MPARGKTFKMTKEQFFAEAMSRQPDRVRSMAKLAKQLQTYENKYRIRSEIFYKLIVGTPLEDQEDFWDWAACYSQYFKIFHRNVCFKKVSEGYKLKGRTNALR